MRYRWIRFNIQAKLTGELRSIGSKNIDTDHVSMVENKKRLGEVDSVGSEAGVTFHGTLAMRL